MSKNRVVDKLMRKPKIDFSGLPEGCNVVNLSNIPEWNKLKEDYSRYEELTPEQQEVLDKRVDALSRKIHTEMDSMVLMSKDSPSDIKS